MTDVFVSGCLLYYMFLCNAEADILRFYITLFNNINNNSEFI